MVVNEVPERFWASLFLPLQSSAAALGPQSHFRTFYGLRVVLVSPRWFRVGLQGFWGGSSKF